MAQTDRANFHSKNKCLMDSSWWQKTQFLQPCQLRLAKLTLVKITLLLRNHRNIFTFRGIFSFHNFLLSIGTSSWTIASYMELTENLPFWCNFHLKIFGSSDNWMAPRRMSNSFHAAKRGPVRSLWKEISGFYWPKTCLIVTNLCLTIRYKLGYCTLKGLVPNQVSSQKPIWEPSLTENIPNWKNNSLAFITPPQKWESPGFQYTWEIALEPTYLLRMISCQTPFSVSSLLSI